MGLRAATDEHNVRPSEVVPVDMHQCIAGTVIDNNQVARINRIRFDSHPSHRADDGLRFVDGCQI